jgi:hypothetical protein
LRRFLTSRFERAPEEGSNGGGNRRKISKKFAHAEKTKKINFERQKWNACRK